MSVNEEPTEGEGVNEFEIPTGLIEAVAGLGDPEIKKRFLEIVAEEGLSDEALSFTPRYIQDIQAVLGEAADKVVDRDLKQAWHHKQQILPQIALGIMLHEAKEEDEADGVFNDVYILLKQALDEDDLAQREYFEALLGLL